MVVDLTGIHDLDVTEAVVVVPETPQPVEKTAEELKAERQAERRVKAKAAYDEAIKDAERKLVDASLLEEHMKGALKGAKAKRIACVEDLQQIRLDGVDAFYEEEVEEKEQPKEPQSGGDSTLADDQEANDDWKGIPTEPLISSIEGLGMKRVGLIAEEFPTLGKLEEAREQASKEHKHFSELLPKGVGKTVADKIEEKMIDAISTFLQNPKPKQKVEAKVENSETNNPDPEPDSDPPPEKPHADETPLPLIAAATAAADDFTDL